MRVVKEVPVLARGCTMSYMDSIFHVSVTPIAAAAAVIAAAAAAIHSLCMHYVAAVFFSYSGCEFFL